MSRAQALGATTTWPISQRGTGASGNGNEKLMNVLEIVLLVTALVAMAVAGTLFAVVRTKRAPARDQVLAEGAHLMRQVRESIHESSKFAVTAMQAAMSERDATNRSMLQLARGEVLQQLVSEYGAGPIVSADGLIRQQIHAVMQNLEVSEEEAKTFLRQGIEHTSAVSNGTTFSHRHDVDIQPGEQAVSERPH